MSNYLITSPDELGKGGAKTKARNNLEAIRVLKQIEQEERTATPGEQDILIKFSGWGAMADLFTGKPEWAALQVEAKALLTDAEYSAARSAILNAHYTPPEVVSEIYAGLKHLGFEGGRILDPSTGATGLFLGMMPPDVQANSEIIGVELDSISGRIARQLYPDATIHVRGFEDVLLPDNYVDLAISNVPFLEVAPSDSRYQGIGIKGLHDYFFVKSLDIVRPGGLIAFVTSVGTIQSSRGNEVRDYLADRSNLVGAMRLPGNTFKQFAGTEASMDLIVLQKLGNGIEPNGVSWKQQHPTSVVDAEGKALTTNEYYVQRPHLMLGTLADDKVHPGRLALLGDGRPIAQAMREAFKEFPANIYQQGKTDEAAKTPFLIPPELQEKVKPNGYVIIDDQLMRRAGNELKPVEVEGARLSRIGGMIRLRDAVQSVFDVQLGRGLDEELKLAQSHLEQVYDEFVAKHGYIHDRGNKLAFGKDPDYPLLLALENYDVDNKIAHKTSIFSERTIQASEPKDYAETAKEALLYSLNERGRIDLQYISSLTSKPESDVITELQADSLIFLDPVNQQWTTSDEYLSGNVRQKLLVAEDRAKNDAQFAPNVEALKTVQPEMIPPGDIEVRLGSTWVPGSDIEAFTKDLLKAEGNVSVRYSSAANSWYVSAADTIERSAGNRKIHGTPRADALRLIELALNLKDPVVYDPDPNDRKRTIVNTEATVEARMKMEDIKFAFKEWIWQDAQRCERLVQVYNEKFNTHRPRQFDGSHLTLPGSNPAIVLRPHQKDAVWRNLQEGNSLLAHACGAGKTFTMIAAAMEQKRLGIAQKPMITVPNHLLEQFSRDFKLLYPNANILSATKEDSAAENRRELMSRIATGNWDAVIVTHSGFGKLGLSRDTQASFYRERLEEIDENINAVESSGEPNSRRVVKDLERKAKWLEQRLDKLYSNNRDTTVTFEQLGVDQIYVDEAHYFKNLGFSTKMYNVAGLPNTMSVRAFDLYMKVRYLAEVNGEGKGVCFATGTPIANTMAEMYIMQKYLQPKTLESAGLYEFDDWASTFGETVTAPEITTAGDYKVKTRFARFVNVPELMNLFREVADIQTSEMLKLPVPELKGGAAQVIPCPATELQLEFTENLARRAENIKNVDPRDDNMLLITGDGRKASLDMRLIHPSFPDDSRTKINRFVSDAFEFWEQTRDTKRTHLLFCDFGTPKQGATSKRTTQVDVEEKHSVYKDIKDKLVQRGIPPEQIAFVQEFKTDAQKKELQRRFSRGDIHLLISGSQLEVGFNGQERLALESHITVPWRPDQIEQRDGRILRQGNTNPEVEIRRYVTQGRDNRPSFDSYSWQTLETKKKAIDQVMNGKSGVRSVEDTSEAAMTYAEVKAIATGNPLIMEKATVDNKVSELSIQKRSYLNSQFRVQQQLRELPDKIDSTTAKIERMKADIAASPEIMLQEFERQITVDGEKKKENFTLATAPFKLINADPTLNPDDPRDVGKHITARAGAKKAIEDYRSEVVAQVGAFPVSLERAWDGFYLKVQGQENYTCDTDRSFLGTYMNVMSVFDRMRRDLGWAERDLATFKENFRDLSQNAHNAPFPKERELQDVLNRQKEINRSLGLDKDNAQATVEAVQTEPAASAQEGEEEGEEEFTGDFASKLADDFAASYLAAAEPADPTDGKVAAVPEEQGKVNSDRSLDLPLSDVPERIAVDSSATQLSQENAINPELQVNSPETLNSPAELDRSPETALAAEPVATKAESADPPAEIALEATSEPEESLATPITSEPEEAVLEPQSIATDEVFPIVANVTTPLGSDLTLRITPATDDPNFYISTFEGATANWAGYPNQSQAHWMSKDDFESMGFDTLVEYAEFAVQQVNNGFLLKLTQEVDRVMPDLKRWMSQNQVSGEAAVEGFLSYYPEAERHGISSELQELVLRVALDVPLRTVDSAQEQSETTVTPAAPVESEPNLTETAALPEPQPDTESSRILIQNLRTGEQSFIDAPPLPPPQIEAIEQPATEQLPLDHIDLAAAHTEVVQPAAAVLEAEKTAENLEKPPQVLPGLYQFGQAEKNVAKFLHEAGLAAALVADESFRLRLEKRDCLPLVVERQGNQFTLSHYRSLGDREVLEGAMTVQLKPVANNIHLRIEVTGMVTQNPVDGEPTRNEDRSFATMFSRSILQQGFAEVAAEALTYQQLKSEEISVSVQPTPETDSIAEATSDSIVVEVQQPAVADESIAPIKAVLLEYLSQQREPVYLDTLQTETGYVLYDSENPDQNPAMIALRELEVEGLVVHGPGLGSIPVFQLTETGRTYCDTALPTYFSQLAEVPLVEAKSQENSAASPPIPDESRTTGADAPIVAPLDEPWKSHEAIAEFAATDLQQQILQQLHGETSLSLDVLQERVSGETISSLHDVEQAQHPVTIAARELYRSGMIEFGKHGEENALFRLSQSGTQYLESASENLQSDAISVPGQTVEVDQPIAPESSTIESDHPDENPISLEKQEALDWLTEQGGLVEMAAVSQHFHDSVFYELEEAGVLQRIVPEGSSRMYWANNDPAETLETAIRPVESDSELIGKLLKRLEEGKARLDDLQREMGYRYQDADKPLSNPVNRVLTTMRDEHQWVTHNEGWGMPVFRLTEAGKQQLRVVKEQQTEVPSLSKEAISEPLPAEPDSRSTERDQSTVTSIADTVEPAVETPALDSAPPLALKLLEQLQSGESRLNTLQQDMGYPRQDGQAPLANPVSAALKDLMGQGMVTMTKDGGSPLFTITDAGLERLKQEITPVTAATELSPPNSAFIATGQQEALNRAREIEAIAQQSYAFAGSMGKLENVNAEWLVKGEKYTLSYDPRSENFWIRGTAPDGMTIQSLRGTIIEGNMQGVTEAHWQEWQKTQQVLQSRGFHSDQTPAQVQALAAIAVEPQAPQAPQQTTLFNLTPYQQEKTFSNRAYDPSWDEVATPKTAPSSPSESAATLPPDRPQKIEKPIPVAELSPQAPMKESEAHPTVPPAAVKGSTPRIDFRELSELRDRRIQEFRETPLEAVAFAAGLDQQDRDVYWREQSDNSQYKIKITDDLFFDVKQNEGGQGAISLAKFLNGLEFMEACRWLDNNLPGRTGLWDTVPLPTHALESRPLDRPMVQPAAPKEPEKYPTCNVRAPQNWHQAERYLTQERGLPLEMVRQLHEAGKLDADSRSNVMFMREQIDFNWQSVGAIGANTRATIPNREGEFLKLMTPLEDGVKKSHGFFTSQQGSGEVMRVVITESAIDAMSYAAIDKRGREDPNRQRTVYLSTDGAGSVPVQLLQQVCDRGGTIVLAQDADRAGYLQAFQIAKELPNASLFRHPPANAKDWNDQLRGRTDPQTSPEVQTLGQIWHWYTTARQPEQQAQILQQAIQVCKPPHSDLNPEVRQQMKEAIVEDLKHWYRQSKMLDRSQKHTDLITEQAKAFISDNIALPKAALWTRQIDSYQWHERVGQMFYQAHYLLDVKGRSCGERQTLLEGVNYTLFRDEATQRLYGFTTDQRRNNKLTEEDRAILPESLIQSGRSLFLKVEGNQPVLSHTRIEKSDLGAIARKVEQFADQAAVR